jgi:hypothetical protein
MILENDVNVLEEGGRGLFKGTIPALAWKE